MGEGMKVSTWHHCYSGNWNKLIIPESFSHPAKFAPGLIRRIFQHCLEQGYLRKGDIVVDPFGGIGGGGIMAAPLGLHWNGIELEQRFVELAWKNFDIHLRDWIAMGYPLPHMVQGDSRRLSDVLGQADLIATSPPFEGISPTRGDPNYVWKFHGDQKDYGHTPGQIGSMMSGSVDSVITSPPYAETIQSHGSGIDYSKRADASNRSNPTSDGSVKRAEELAGSYSSSPSNIGNLKAGQGDSYWQAVADVYRECRKILKPGGVMVIVVKSYVKAGRRVPLPMQTLKLLIHLGFAPLERIKAMLVFETITAGLFGEISRRKEKKSFFRRLAEKKGSPKINWEEVLIVCNPIDL